MLWVAKEWQGSSGKWYCGCVDKLGSDSGAWFIPARILGWDPADYIEYVIKNFNPNVYYNKEKCLVFFSWEKQADMRRYKNWINAAARKINYQI